MCVQVTKTATISFKENPLSHFFVGVVDMELWLLCVATPKFSTVQRPFNTGLVNQHSQGSFTRSFADFKNKFKSMNSPFQICSFIMTGM
jgi:hypothetical protein